MADQECVCLYLLLEAAGYGVLRYSSTNDSTLPNAPLPQPGSVQPWTIEQLDQVAPKRLPCEQAGRMAVTVNTEQLHRIVPAASTSCTTTFL